MATATLTRVEVNLTEKSVTYVANTVIQILFRITHSRGLSPEYLQQNLEIIENGLRTWLAEQKLRSLLLQVSRPGAGGALENWETVFEYSADPRSEVGKPPIQHVEEACRALAALPAGAEYRIFAHLDPDASEVPGWVPGTPLSIAVAVEKAFDAWGFGNIGAKVRYQGGKW